MDEEERRHTAGDRPSHEEGSFLDSPVMSRQLARRAADGELELVEVPVPACTSGTVLVRLEASVLSPGTERATLAGAHRTLVGRAVARPDRVRAIWDRVREEGLRSTIEGVRGTLAGLLPLGYSAAGVVVESGPEVRRLVPGDRVAIAGAGFANHAEFDLVPSLMCAPIPADVPSESAAFSTLGAIAMNGFRRAGLEVGSTVAVLGLGLVGQLAVRIARAAGCRVQAADLVPELVDLARRGGADGKLRADLDADRRWQGQADAVLVCASAPGNDPIELAAALARDRGTVVVVGDVGMDVPRAPFYEKELSLRLARSYGPGRYDPQYELHGLDYPIGYVRWTQQRNMIAFLDLVADGKLQPEELVTHRFPFTEARSAFEALKSERVVGVVLEYEVSGPGTSAEAQDARAAPPGSAAEQEAPGKRVLSRSAATGKPRYGLIGAGSFAMRTLAPGLHRAGFEPVAVTSTTGLSAEQAKRQFGFRAVEASADELIDRDDLDLIVIATRHDSHANLAAACLNRGVAVYVEKPLALDWHGLRDVRSAETRSGAPLFVGFNRRYAPLAGELRGFPGPKLMTYRVNAGRVSHKHWTNDPVRGGGRLKGEGCHFIDFLCHQVEADPLSVICRGFRSSGEMPLVSTDNFSLQISFEDGSVGTVHYAADAPTGPGKERFEVSAPNAYGVIDDFRWGTIWRGSTKRKTGEKRQDKGFSAQFAALAGALHGTEELPSAESYYLATLATLSAARSLETGHEEIIMDRAAAAAVTGPGR